MANIFTPTTIDASLAHSGQGSVPGLKEDDAWCVGGHRDRIIEVNEGTLRLFADLYDEPGTPLRRRACPPCTRGSW
ncbi:MAG: hypothetical protein U0234_00625 [Sandaracinus sp.]